MVISVLLVLFASFVCALNMSLSIPESVAINEEFYVSISSDSTDLNYDVKIFVHNSEDNKIDRPEYISEIYDDASSIWKDSYYYILNSFPETKEYEIKLKSSPGDRKICLRLRKSPSEDSSFEQACNNIEITEGEESKTDSSPEKKIVKTANEKSQVSENQTSTNKESLEFQPISQEKINNNEKIILNSKTENTEQIAQTYSSKQEKIKFGIIYGFIIFCVVVIILLALRRL